MVLHPQRPACGSRRPGWAQAASQRGRPSSRGRRPSRRRIEPHHRASGGDSGHPDDRLPLPWYLAESLAAANGVGDERGRRDHVQERAARTEERRPDDEQCAPLEDHPPAVAGQPERLVRNGAVNANPFAVAGMPGCPLGACLTAGRVRPGHVTGLDTPVPEGQRTKGGPWNNPASMGRLVLTRCGLPASTAPLSRRSQWLCGSSGSGTAVRTSMRSASRRRKWFTCCSMSPARSAPSVGSSPCAAEFRMPPICSIFDVLRQSILQCEGSLNRHESTASRKTPGPKLFNRRAEGHLQGRPGQHDRCGWATSSSSFSFRTCSIRSVLATVRRMIGMRLRDPDDPSLNRSAQARRTSPSARAPVSIGVVGRSCRRLR